MIKEVLTTLEALRNKLVKHSLYDNLESIEDIKSFTTFHVYAVWDFMSLLKALQVQLTCVSVPWVPTNNPKTRRFINEIVLGEESDEDSNGKTLSHFEMYLDAMKGIGADTSEIQKFLGFLNNGHSVPASLDLVTSNKAVKEFVNFTFEAIHTQKPHVIAAVFTFGREDLIPDMFIGLLKGLSQDSEMDELVYYFERHIELDGDDHGPMSLAMIEELCVEDQKKWDEVEFYSKRALEKRIALWDAIDAYISVNNAVLT
jgi:hypothetical protein